MSKDASYDILKGYHMPHLRLLNIHIQNDVFTEFFT